MTRKKIKIDDNQNIQSEVKDMRNIQKIHENMPVFCEEFMLSSLRPYILEWIKTHGGFSDIVLFEFFQKYIKKVQTDLRQVIPEINIHSLYKINSKLQWDNFVKTSGDIFNRHRIL